MDGTGSFFVKNLGKFCLIKRIIIEIQKNLCYNTSVLITNIDNQQRSSGLKSRRWF